MHTFGINGFGRIGRTTLRVWWQSYRRSKNLKVVNTSGSMSIGDWVHLLQYDTNYRTFPEKITYTEKQPHTEVTDEDPVLGTMYIGSHEIIITAQRDPQKMRWDSYGVETVIESTGVFVSKEKASLHLEAGAKRVIISAPGKGDGIANSVIGVKEYKDSDTIVSNASCTTNCVAPVAAVIEKEIGIEKAMLTTIHSYTDDQNLQDNSHKGDMRRARNAAQNSIPTSTGAAKATTLLLPELSGKFDGLAVRVPSPVGSLSDMVFLTSRNTTVEEVNEIFRVAAAEDRWQGILAVTEDPIVSSDIIGRSESSIVDLALTMVVGGNLLKVVSWYDNEWGYCHRLIEQIR